jgi:hypothetical protein
MSKDDSQPLIPAERTEQATLVIRSLTVMLDRDLARKPLIFDVTTPGTWLDYPDRDSAWKIKIERLLQSLRDQFYEANAALNLFVEASARQSSQFMIPTSEQRRADAEQREQIRRQVEADLGLEDSPKSWHRIDHETEVRFKREKWASGHVPPELESKVLPIFARAFVYALDSFDKFLAVLAKEPGVPARVGELSDSFADLFPGLRGVRNTTHHLEDRSRGLDRDKSRCSFSRFRPRRLAHPAETY